jgi:hypothetical protein
MDLPENEVVAFDDAAMTRNGKMQEQLTFVVAAAALSPV